MRVCERSWSEPLSAFIDGELEPKERARVEAHLARCERCRAAVRTYRSIGAAMRARTGESAVASELETRLRRQLLREARSSAMPKRLHWAWVAVSGAAIAAAVMLGVMQRPDSALDEALADELVSHHLRGFARRRPCEIESDDPEEVREWVEARFGYRVEVPKPEGVELMGARACRIEGQETAALMYRYDEVPMTVFVPPPGSTAIASAERFASSGARCTMGPIGERICVSAEQPAFAVSSLPEAQMLSLMR